jgi:hypothetical protein
MFHGFNLTVHEAGAAGKQAMLAFCRQEARKSTATPYFSTIEMDGSAHTGFLY